MQRTIGGLLLAVVLLGAGLWVGTILERRKWDGKLAQVDTLYLTSVRLDTLYITKWRVDVETLPQVVINDTVYIPKEPAQNAIKACEAALSGCAQARDSLYRINHSLRTRLERAEADGKRCGGSLAVGTGVGATYGLLTRQIDVGPTLYGGVNILCRKLF